MRGFLRFFRLAEYGGDELILVILTCTALAWLMIVLLGIPFWWIGFLPLLFFLWFFRDPNRSVPSDPNIFVSPADGRVQDITDMEETDYIKGPAVRIGIFLSPFNVHVNRSPCEGTVRFSLYRKGEFLPAYNPDAPTRNESWTLGLNCEYQFPIVVKQITGIAARRIVCNPNEGELLKRGQRYGMIKFGSRTELYLPKEVACEIKVSVGDNVVGGETILAVMPDK